MPVRSRRAVLAAGAVGLLGLLVAPGAAAWAADYPSWSDVLAARGNVKKKAAQVARIKQLLATSKAAAAKAQREADAKGAAYQGAVARVDAATDRLAAIEQRVKEDDARAAAATQRAGQLAAQLTRTGGADPETTLFFEGGGDAEDFLAKLGRLSKLTESNGAIADQAQQARNAAAATRAQVQQAKAQLVGLRDDAKVALDAAVKANEAAQAQVRRQQAAQVELQARLDALQAASASVARRYQQGVAERRRAAAAASSAGSAGAVQDNGWARPATGPITGRFGPRPDQPAGANLFHRGTDIAAGYGAPIYAAHAGTVTYAGPFGTYGNWIEIDDGDGIQTGYAHIRPGGIFVHVGQHVQAGQNIASVGQTGAATGPHLHFETRIHEVAVDAQPFMAARGIILG